MHAHGAAARRGCRPARREVRRQQSEWVRLSWRVIRGGKGTRPPSEDRREALARRGTEQRCMSKAETHTAKDRAAYVGKTMGGNRVQGPRLQRRRGGLGGGMGAQFVV